MKHRRGLSIGVAVVVTLAVTAGLTYAAGTRAASSAVSDFFARCAAATVASPPGCPQSSPDTGTDFRWVLVGDPSSSLAFSLGASGTLRATGHYLMLDSFGGTFPNGVRHRVQGGPFEALLKWEGGAMKVQRVTTATAPHLTPPSAVSDAALKSTVAEAFRNCVTAPPDGAPDCPQFDFAPSATNFKWTINGDPLADSTVTYDGDRGVWQVMGNYSFHDSFDLASGHEEHDVNGTYFAYVVYDGSKLIPVYIRHI